MASRTIPDHLIGEVLSRAAAKEPTRAISAWLREAHGVEASYGAVARLLKEHREERGEVTRDEVQVKLAPLVTSDIDYLDELRERSRAIAEASVEDAEESKDPEIAAKCRSVAIRAIAEERQITNDRLRFAGADPDDSPAATLADMLGAVAAAVEGSSDE